MGGGGRPVGGATAPDGPPDPARVVQLWVEHADGKGDFGSGYAVGGRAVLTAWHVVKRAVAPGDGAGEGGRRGSVLQVRSASAPSGSPYVPARVVWFGEAYDVALLEADDALVPDPVPEVPWGRLEGPAPVSCTAVGFPARAAAGRLRDTDQLIGEVAPLALHKAHRIAVDAHGAGGGHESWGGFSGSALFAAGAMVGVVLKVSKVAAYGGRRLTAHPIEQLWREGEFREAAARMGLHGTLVPVHGGTGWNPLGVPTRQDFVEAVSEGVRLAGLARIPDRARATLLARVREDWLHDSLERSFLDTVPLDVSCRLRRDLATHAWARDDGWAAPPEPPGPPLTADEVYRSYLVPPDRRRLLIVGAPGAGKTTLLLALADRLVDAAYPDRGAVVPLPLLLQDWRDSETPFADWLVEEIGSHYGVLRADAVAWLSSGGLFLMLDGLDELPAVRRRDARAQIAAFFADPAYSAVGIVVTCREEEYRDGPPLKVRHAVAVEPLDRDTVLRRLSESPDDFTALRDAVRDDDVLAEILTTPLMLGIAASALRDADPDTLPRGTADERRAHLYHRYLEQLMLRPRGLLPGVGRATAVTTLAAVRGLVPLARLMAARGEGVFYPDWITPTWIDDGYAARPPWRPSAGERARTVMAMAVPLLMFALVAAPLFTAAGLLAMGDDGTRFAAAGTLAFALGRGFEVLPEPAWARWTWSWRAAGRGALQAVALTLGILAVAALVLGSIANDMIAFWVIAGAATGTAVLLTLLLNAEARSGSRVRLLLVLALGAAVGGTVGGVDTPWSHALDLETLARGWPELDEYFGQAFGALPDGLFDGTNVGLVAGVVGAFVGGWAGGVTFGFTYGLMGALPGTLVCGTAFALVHGMVPDRESPPASPSSALHASGRVSLLVCAAFAGGAGVASAAVGWLGGPLAGTAAVALAAFALLVGSGPARTWLTYWSTRWSLAARGVLPWRLARFLDDASERALLTRVGGGYRFVHTEFRDFVAGLDERDAAAVGPDGVVTVRDAPAWQGGASRPGGGEAADAAVLRRWWGMSAPSRALGRIGSAAIAATRTRPARLLGRALRAVGTALLWVAARAWPAVVGGWFAAGLVAWATGWDDMSFPLIGGCVLAVGLLEAVWVFGLRPAGRRRLGRAVGLVFDWMIGKPLKGLDAWLQRHPHVRAAVGWSAVGTAAGFFVSRIIADLPGTGPEVDAAAGWLLSGAGGAGTLVFVLFRRGVLK
ncbi:serine protease [Yinghuangia seranimata]|uniref:serine protease n=1 Tax=Yinghuangia seranimata TaxID=408067 RepID=UPI00248D28E9|nr:serine protease [Yinghuangia seranimata]MDI2131701.1 NACHT domain-containing protein [Yinghuangia seranimata]